MRIETPPEYYGLEVMISHAKLYASAEMRAIMQRANEDYQYWQKYKYRDFPEGIEPELAWKLLKVHREFSKISLGFAHLPALHFVPTDTLTEQFHLFDQRLGGMIGFSEDFDVQDRRQFVRNALMEEAIASSKLEGASTERKRAKEMLRSNREPVDLSERMIANNYAAMQFVASDLTRPIDEGYLLELHAIATKNTLDEAEWEGRYRVGGNVVVDSTTNEIVYNAPPREELEGLMADVFNFLTKKDHRPFVHPLARASIIHFLIGYIHPFEDGNGRTARALMYAYMMRNGYWQTEYLVVSKAIASSRAGYDKAYLHTEHDGLDVTYFVHYQTKALSRTVEQLEGYISRQLRKRKRAYRLHIEQGYNARQVRLLDRMEGDPAYTTTVKEHMNKHEVTQPTARQDLEDLVERNIMQRARKGRQMVYFKHQQ